MRRGRLEIVLHLEDAEVELLVDPAGSSFCVLDAQEATVVAATLTRHASEISAQFEHREELHGLANTYVVDEFARSRTWQTNGGPLAVAINANRDLIRLGDSERMAVRLRARPLTELIQWIEALVTKR